MRSAIRVLIVEDAEDDALLMLRVLTRAGLAVEPTRVETTEALKQALAGQPWDLLLVDWRLPTFDGWEALRVIRESGTDLPFIIVSGVIGEATAVAAMKAGAHDFVGKDQLDRLAPVVERELADAEVRRARREAEEALRLSLAELAAANERLKAADRHKDDFLGVVSHELRTPLNFIMGFADLLGGGVAGEVNEAQQEYIDKIIQGAERMLHMVNDLIDMSRIQAGRLSIEREEADLAAILCDVVGSLEPLARARRLRVSSAIDIGRSAPLDAARMFQVFTNLVGNAIKFTPEGGEIHLTGVLEGEAIVVSIADTGHGIDEADLPRLFRPFSQLDMTRTRHAEGAGLGLSICHALVTAHGGTIDVESQVGHGTTFRVRLPIVAAEALAPSASQVPAD